MRALACAVAVACGGPARQPPQPPPPSHIEVEIVDEPGGPPGSRDVVDDPQPALTPAQQPAAGALVPSKPAKAYKGREGAVIVMIEVDDGKQMVVHFRHIDRALDGKTLLYRIEDLGDGNKNVYVDKKRGSKTYRSSILIARDGWWQFFHPYQAGVQFHLAYSESESRNLNVDDVMSTYNPDKEPSR